MPMDLAAYWYSLRYQKPRQFTGRARYWLGWKYYPRFPAAVRGWCERNSASARPRADFRWQPRAGAQTPSAPAVPVNWHPAGASLLDLFQLHYFDWAPRCEPGQLARHIESWIDANPPGSWPSWHPYPTSLRMVNWIRAAALPGATESLALQAAFLERNLEFHLGGNHLLENARALLAAGLYFEGPSADRWRSTGLDLLCRELATQVLPDGGHFERSPYYHHRMLALVFDSIDLLTQNARKVPPALADAGGRMSIFARALRHQDGGLPLFHDGLGCETAIEVGDGPPSFPASGYYILDTRHGRLIADYGAPGACYNPGHQHAGIFSFEISSGAHRIAVDSGTTTYNTEPDRDHLRSTAAHNTVCVDGADQFQAWGGFRVGRRAWVGRVDERHGLLVSAAHSGYRRLGLEHRRTIVALPDTGWLILDDLSGRGEHRLESFLHLAPGITPQVHGARVCLQPIGWMLASFGFDQPAEVISDRHSPAIGISQPSQTLVFRAGSRLPRRFGYILGPEQAIASLDSPAEIADRYYRQAG